MEKTKTPREYTNEEKLLIGIGYDMCIDKIYHHMTKQVEALEAAKRLNSSLATSEAKEAVRHLQEHFKKSKGDPDFQVFSIQEVREVVDHVTGTTQSANTATMSYFDEVVMPLLVKGKLMLKKFTPVKEEKNEDKN